MPPAALMGEIRIHRSDPARFAKIPNDTLFGTALREHPAALGYLVWAIAQDPAKWEGETVAEAVARMRQPVAAVRAIFRTLEAAGFRHRVPRRGPGGKVLTETHYYDLQTRPCQDERTCLNCKAAAAAETPGHAGNRPDRTRPDLGKRNSAGRWAK